MEHNKSVLVTGSSGKLGRATVQLLRERGYHVVGADLLPGAYTDLLLDIRDAIATQAALHAVDAVIHTAALHGYHFDLQVPRLDFVRTNIEGTLNLLNACLFQGASKFLYVSTTSIYGQAMVNREQAVWVDEQLTPQPRDIYDITKQSAEALCRDFFEREGLETVVLRVGRFLPEPLDLAITHRLYRGLDERDGAAGLLLALEYSFNTFEVFNIAAGSPFQREDLLDLKYNPQAALARRLPNLASTYQRLNWQLPASIDRVYSIEKAQRILGYTPHYTAEWLIQQAE